MSQAETFYEGHSLYGGLTWSSPTKLLALIRKLEAIENKSPRVHTFIGTLDAVEGYYLRRYAPPVEPRCISAGDDWPLCT